MTWKPPGEWTTERRVTMHYELLALVDEMAKEGFLVARVDMVDRDGTPAVTLELEAVGVARDDWPT